MERKGKGKFQFLPLEQKNKINNIHSSLMGNFFAIYKKGSAIREAEK